MIRYFLGLLISLSLVIPIYAGQVTVCNNIKINYRYPFVSVYIYIKNSTRPIVQQIVILGSQSKTINTPFIISKMQTLQNDCPSCKSQAICSELNKKTFKKSAFIKITGAGFNPATCSISKSSCNSD